jgi:hypothetical protein
MMELSLIRPSAKSSLWALLVTLILLGAAPRCDAVENLLHNGNFSVGSGDSVDGWRTEAWVQDEGTTDYHWIPPAPGKPGELELFSHRDNDARWQQPLSLAPGWYYISADARTDGVQNFVTGANVSVLDGGIMSEDLKGDTDWHRLGLYLKIGPQGADVDVCLRLGGYGNLTRGQAFFRNARIEKVGEPPAGAEHVFDLAAVRKAQITPPIGRPWTLFATILFLGLLGALGWWLMAEPLPERVAAAPVAVAPPPGKRRKRARAR